MVGIDLVNIQPERYVSWTVKAPRGQFTKSYDSIPPNLRFRIPRDFESPWFLGEDSWDMIHLRMGLGSVSSWPELYQKIFRYVAFGPMDLRFENTGIPLTYA